MAQVFIALLVLLFVFFAILVIRDLSAKQRARRLSQERRYRLHTDQHTINFNERAEWRKTILKELVLLAMILVAIVGGIFLLLGY